MTQESSHLVLIPSYNSGGKLAETVAGALRYWPYVWVVIDGSTDGSDQALAELEHAGRVRLIRLKQNQGKGGAVIAGMRAAQAAGFRFALVMDADGQHPAEKIPEFMQISMVNPQAMVLGVPDFAADAPAARRHGRRVGNWWANLETLWGGITDSLFGFRVYPIGESLQVLEPVSRGRGYDFDTELVVRLYWRKVRPINILVPVRYYSKVNGGISHFHYVRDNLLLFKAHTCLVLGMLLRFFTLWQLRRRP